jgi:hypothetical protein
MDLIKYTYSVQNDFVNHKVDSDSLENEISASNITVALDHTDVILETTCNIYFKGTLSQDEEIILNAIVATHQGITAAPAPTPISFPEHMVTSDGRLVIRNTIAIHGTQNLRCMTFYTSDPSKIVNKNSDGSDVGDVIVKCFDADNVEITSAPYTNAIKTQVDFEPNYNYEIIGGRVFIHPDIINSVTNEWLAWAMGAPDVPVEMGGSICFVNCVNLEQAGSVFEIDGRATSVMPLNLTYHTGKIRFIIKHPAGASKRFHVPLELYS